MIVKRATDPACGLTIPLPEFDVMELGAASSFSALEKPLSLLTEEDISQLTREDCRKYLKEKGMRRPSWNKSQAIQQVMSIKALLEGSEDSGAGTLLRLLGSLPADTPSEVPGLDYSMKEFFNGDETTPCFGSPKSTTFSDELSCQPTKTDVNVVGSRSSSETDRLAGQMTIFYCGKVNVYDGVPPDKAQKILEVAASSIHFDNNPLGIEHLRVPPTSQQGMQSEGHGKREVSLQRFLSKRKDRRRFKSRNNTEATSSGLEAFLNNKIGKNTNQIGKTSPSANDPGFPFDLNEDLHGCQICI